MKVSIKDIAKKAGVSYSTVSRALRDSPLISKKTKIRIVKIAKKMRYSPSAIARSLVTKRTETIGLVITNISDTFIAEIVRGIEERALDEGYGVILCQSGNEQKREIEAVRILNEKRVDGMIVTASRVGDLYQSLLNEIGVPIVLINNQGKGEYIYSVSTDNKHGAWVAIKYLIDLGHKKIGYIACRSKERSNNERMEGYKKALKEHKIEFKPQFISEGNGEVKGGIKGMKKLLSIEPHPTAIFCYNDRTAIGAILEVKKDGLRVPEDISIIGFDDIEMASYINPPLTTIRQYRYDMGRMATEIVLNLLSNKESVTDIIIKGKLIIRKSCKRLT